MKQTPTVLQRWIMRIPLMWLIITLASVRLIAQDQKTIDTIIFEGNNKNRNSHLRRSIQLHEGQLATIQKIDEDAQSLQNLSSVSQVQWSADTTASGIVLTYLLKESLTLFPIINLGRVAGNHWWMLGFKDFSFLGRGDYFSTFYQNIDRRHNFSIEYRRAYFGDSKWGAGINLRRYASVEPFFFRDHPAPVFYAYTNHSIGLSAHYHLQHRHIIEFGTTYFQEDYHKDSRHQDSTTPGPETRVEPKLLLKAIHQIDRINYSYFIQHGIANQLILQTVVNIHEDYLFHMLLNNFTFFKEMPYHGNLAGRLRIGWSTNNDSPFAPFVLDSYVNIRGVGNRIDRGTAALILNLEYRQRMFETGIFGVQWVIFSDAGTWRRPGGTVRDFSDPNIIQHFVGTGARIILKRAHNASLRIDYGWSIRSQHDRRGFVLGLGQYF